MMFEPNEVKFPLELNLSRLRMCREMWGHLGWTRMRADADLVLSWCRHKSPRADRLEFVLLLTNFYNKFSNLYNLFKTWCPHQRFSFLPEVFVVFSAILFVFKSNNIHFIIIRHFSAFFYMDPNRRLLVWWIEVHTPVKLILHITIYIFLNRYFLSFLPKFFSVQQIEWSVQHLNEFVRFCDFCTRDICAATLAPRLLRMQLQFFWNMERDFNKIKNLVIIIIRTSL
jgi:hypothetical protein